MSGCVVPAFDIGIVRDILGSVDCNVQVYSAAGYRALTGPGSPLPAALTALMTIYVALLGYRLLFAVGGTRLSQWPLIALKIGAILAVTLNWSVFQTLVFNLGAQAPLEIGRVVSRPMATGGPALGEDPVAGLQTVYDELRASAAELSRKSGQAAQASQAAQGGPPTPASADEAATASELRRASMALLASTVGLLAMAFIATGVLTAVGPVFIALLLLQATAGLFVGWLRALMAAVLAPMVCWIGASLLLVVIAPRIEALALQRVAHRIDLDAAAAASAIVLIFAAAQVALVVGGLIIAMGFRLGSRTVPSQASPAPVRQVEVPAGAVVARSRAQALATDLRRASASYDRGYRLPMPDGESDRLDSAVASPDAAAPRPVRLGEAYPRRIATRDRAHLGARA